VDVVMAGHLLVPALDPKQPATLSRPILTGLLRDRLGFKGVVMTDSLWMAGIRSRVSSDAEAALDAFMAGADILLMPPDLPGTVARFRAALRSGALGEKRLDASVERILRLKQRLGLLDAGWYPHAALPSSSTLQADAAVAREAASAAVTLVACRSLPRLDSGALVVGFDAPARALAGAIPGASAYAIGYDPSAAARAAVLDAARRAKSVILLTYDAGGSPGQRELIAQLAPLAVPLIAVSIDLPYDVALTGAADAQLATYGSGTISMRGLAVTLLTNRFAGRLPVAVGSLRGGLSTCR
jgi:beta-N-acetylhexosaminidase